MGCPGKRVEAAGFVRGLAPPIDAESTAALDRSFGYRPFRPEVDEARPQPVNALTFGVTGVLYLCIATFMHMHWFWTASPRFWGYAQLGKMIAAVGVIGSLAFFFIAVLAS
jgi:hypothetical protein